VVKKLGTKGGPRNNKSEVRERGRGGLKKNFGFRGEKGDPGGNGFTKDD